MDIRSDRRAGTKQLICQNTFPMGSFDLFTKFYNIYRKILCLFKHNTFSHLEHLKVILHVLKRSVKS